MLEKKTKARQRRKNDLRIIAKRKSLYEARFGEIYNPDKKGRLRKTNPFTCGVPNCPLCTNPRRVFGLPTVDEVKANLSLKEELRLLV